MGLGGSATNDAGAGMLAALGAGAPHDLARGGLALADLSDDALAGARRPPANGSGVELVLATDVESPLLGLQGASAVFSPQKGASPEVAQALEGALGRFVEVVRRTLAGADRPADRCRPSPRQEPGRRRRRWARLRAAPCSGASGSAASRRCSRRSGSATSLRAADLVVTGEGCFDWQSLQGKVVAGVAAAGPRDGDAQRRHRRPDARGSPRGDDPRTFRAATPWPTPPPRSRQRWPTPSARLAARAARVAATWSPQG